MLNPFPDLLIYSSFAPLVVRVGIGLVFLALAYYHLGPQRNKVAALFAARAGSWGPLLVWKFGALEFLAALFLIAGFLTQVAAAVAALLALFMLLVREKAPVFAHESGLFYSLVIIASLSLMLSGAGALAIDLPL